MSHRPPFLPARRAPSARRLFLPLLAAALLSGCASTRVSDFRRTNFVAPQPGLILIAVPVIGSGDPERDRAMEQAGRLIGADLVRRLTKAGLRAARIGTEYRPGDAPDAETRPGSALLEVRLRAIRKGSGAERMLIGFGAGRAELTADIDFRPDRDAPPRFSFAARSHTGARPGMILPVGAAVATGGSYLLLSTGLHIGSELPGPLRKTIAPLDRTILARLKEEYRAAGWAWPRKGG